MPVLHQTVHLSVLVKKKVTLVIKREDLLHPFISGNKFRKLKYNLLEAQNRQATTLVSFGGAYSNHIAALAYAGQQYGLRTLGIIRGEELITHWQDNPTLASAHAQGMLFKFISRTAYRQKDDPGFLKALEQEVGPCYLLPEGGTNALAIKGCEEILGPEDRDFQVICASVGTGGTLAGIINASDPKQQVLGFAALKGDFLIKDIRKFVTKENWSLQEDYHFNGYAKVSKGLIEFMNSFRAQTGIPTDPIYTGKMLFGIMDLVEQDYFAPGTRILAIHTGGLQGIAGMNSTLKKKGLPLIEIG